MYTISIRSMTQVNSTEILIYSDQSVDPAYKVEVADLKMEEGSAGSLTLKIPVGNAGYDSLEELSTQVIVRKDTVTINPDKVYWIGRLLNVKIDFNNTKEVVFEGAFNYMMDTIQLPSKSTCSLSAWVDFLLNRHNTICNTSGEHYKKVYKGTFDPTIDSVAHDFFTDYETTQEMISNAIQYDEAHVFYRYQYDSTNGCWNLYLDFSKNYYNAGESTPVISFGQNLMDYSRSYEPDELATVIIPRGDRYTDTEWYNVTHVVGGANLEDVDAPSELDHYYTVWSRPTTTDHTLHEYTVYANSTMVNRFGYVSKIVDFDGVRDYDTLLSLAQNYLANQKWIKLTIDISAVDMKLLAPSLDIDVITVGYMIHCISQPHGLNYLYPCTAIEENLLDVSSSRYTLGTGDVQYITDAQRNADEKLKEIVRKNAEREAILTDNILHKPTNLFENIQASIDAVETLAEQDIVTVKTDAKQYALNLLNIFDSELNDNYKGYVHFLKETQDYTIDDSVMDWVRLKQMVLACYTNPSSTVTSTINEFFNYVLNNGYLNDNSNYVVLVAIEKANPKDIAIVVFYSDDNHLIEKKPFFYTSYNRKVFTGYNSGSGGYWRTQAKFHTKRGVGTPYIGMGANERLGLVAEVRPDWSYQDIGAIGNLDNYANPNWNTFFNNPDSIIYCSKDVWSSSISGEYAFRANLVKEAKRSKLSLGDLRTKFKAVAGSSYTTTIDTFFDNVKYYLDTESDTYKYMVMADICKSDNTKMCLTVYKVDKRFVDSNGQIYAYSYTSGGVDYLYFNIYDSYNSTPMYQMVMLTGGVENSAFSQRTDQLNIDGRGNASFLSPSWSSTQVYRTIFANSATAEDTNSEIYFSSNVILVNNEVKYTTNLINSFDPFTEERDHIYEIVVSNFKDYMNPDPNNWCWRWNKYGLYSLKGGYSDINLPDGTYQDANDRLHLALTYDGQIVADRITAGILNADVIKTGVIRSRPIGTAEPDGNMMIDIPNGNIIAKKGTLIFNDMREVQRISQVGTISQPLDGFIYISNVDCLDSDNLPVYMNIGGHQSNKWRIVSGDSFGVDNAGRVFMREGIIGATGGIFDPVAKNTSYVPCTAAQISEGVYHFLWSCVFNTDCARPMMEESQITETCWFRFRLAHYDNNNEFAFVTKLYSFLFPDGKSEVRYSSQEFYPILSATSMSDDPPYYQGELFPVWYYLNDSATEDYYEQDGHRYVLYGSSGNVITSTGTPPKYTCSTNTRYQSSGSSAGSVNIGSGYLSNGTFGQNKSFYLGGIKRSGTVANNTRDDWRFSVGSKFGVTENGNIYCTDMYARGAYLDRCTVTGNITATSVTHLNLNSHNIWDGESKFTNYRWRINIDPTSYGGGMFASNTDFYVFTEDDPQVVPNKSATFSFKVYLEQVPIEQPSAQPSDKYIETFNFTYNRSGTAGIAQRIQLDTRSWSTPDSGYVVATDGSGNPLIKIGLIEMETAESSSFVYIGFTQEKDCPTATGQGTEFYTYIEGTFTTANVSGVSRDAVACSCDFIGPSKWLGGPRNFWAKAYISEVNNTVSGSGSSKLYKENVEPLNGRYSDLFDKLKPVRYNFRKEIYDDDGKYHTGFIMEDLGESMKQLDIPEKDFAAYNPDHENGGGNIRYDELIALAVDEIQKLKKRVNELERQLYEKDLFDDTDD